MKKFTLNILVFIQLLSFFIASIFIITLKISFIFTLYEYFYTKTNLAWYLDISDTQLLSYTDNLLIYLKTNQPLDSTWFTEKDILHMVDVRNLYQNSLSITYILFSIFLITSFIIIVIKKRSSFTFVSQKFNKILFSFIIIMLILGLYIVTDFNSFWINFHLLTFDNDLWLLSPLESNLIKMFPEEFFFFLVSVIISCIVLYFSLLFIIMKIIKNNS